MGGRISGFKELNVYQNAMDAAMMIFDLSRDFPMYERFNLTHQVLRSSRSVCANITEGWRRRRYRAAFIAKLNDAETEASETICWLDFCLRCDYLDQATVVSLEKRYDHIIAQLNRMISEPQNWIR